MIIVNTIYTSGLKKVRWEPTEASAKRIFDHKVKQARAHPERLVQSVEVRDPNGDLIINQWDRDFDKH